MATQIYGHYLRFLDDGTTAPETGVTEAAPFKRPARSLVGGEWVDETDIPRKAEADEHGRWMLTLPEIAESNYADQTWIITLKGGMRYQGTVPAPGGGPFTVDDLVNSHGWNPLDPGDAGAITTIQAYDLFKNLGSAVTKRRTINLGAGLTATDNTGTGETDLTVKATVAFPDVQTALAAATGDVGFNNHKLTSVATGTANGDGVNKAQMDTAITNALPAASNLNPQPLGTADPGNSFPYSREGHIHAHGNLAGGSLHAAAIAGSPGTNGFITGANQLKLDGIEAGAQVVTSAAVLAALASNTNPIDLNKQVITNSAISGLANITLQPGADSTTEQANANSADGTVSGPEFDAIGQSYDVTFSADWDGGPILATDPNGNTETYTKPGGGGIRLGSNVLTSTGAGVVFTWTPGSNGTISIKCGKRIALPTLDSQTATYNITYGASPGLNDISASSPIFAMKMTDPPLLVSTNGWGLDGNSQPFWASSAAITAGEYFQVVIYATMTPV